MIEINNERGNLVPDTWMLFCQREDGQSRIQVRLSDGTVWLSQRLMAELCQEATYTISEHISTICSDHELTLDMILAIGCRGRPPGQARSTFDAGASITASQS